MNEKQKLGLESAFPTDARDCGALFNKEYTGMSKRFYAACILLPSFIGSQHEDCQIEHRVNNCYRYVDELLKQENI